jgi:hypothetical protein
MAEVMVNYFAGKLLGLNEIDHANPYAWKEVGS